MIEISRTVLGVKKKHAFLINKKAWVFFWLDHQEKRIKYK